MQRSTWNRKICAFKKPFNFCKLKGSNWLHKRWCCCQFAWKTDWDPDQMSRFPQICKTATNRLRPHTPRTKERNATRGNLGAWGAGVSEVAAANKEVRSVEALLDRHCPITDEFCLTHQVSKQIRNIFFCRGFQFLQQSSYYPSKTQEGLLVYIL